MIFLKLRILKKIIIFPFFDYNFFGIVKFDIKYQNINKNKIFKYFYFTLQIFTLKVKYNGTYNVPFKNYNFLAYRKNLTQAPVFIDAPKF